MVLIITLCEELQMPMSLIYPRWRVRKHHLTEARRVVVISEGCMEAVKTWKYH